MNGRMKMDWSINVERARTPDLDEQTLKVSFYVTDTEERIQKFINDYIETIATKVMESIANMQQ